MPVQQQGPGGAGLAGVGVRAPPDLGESYSRSRDQVLRSRLPTVPAAAAAKLCDWVSQRQAPLPLTGRARPKLRPRTGREHGPECYGCCSRCESPYEVQRPRATSLDHFSQGHLSAHNLNPSLLSMSCEGCLLVETLRVCSISIFRHMPYPRPLLAFCPTPSWVCACACACA